MMGRREGGTEATPGGAEAPWDEEQLGLLKKSTPARKGKGSHSRGKRFSRREKGRPRRLPSKDWEREGAAREGCFVR